MTQHVGTNEMQMVGNAAPMPSARQSFARYHPSPSFGSHVNEALVQYAEENWQEQELLADLRRANEARDRLLEEIDEQANKAKGDRNVAGPVAAFSQPAATIAPIDMPPNIHHHMYVEQKRLAFIASQLADTLMPGAN